MRTPPKSLETTASSVLRRHLPTPSRWVLAFGVLLALVIIASLTWLTINDKRANLKADQSKAELLARVLVDQASRTLEAGIFALRSATSLPELRSNSLDRQGSEAALAQVLSRNPFLREVALLNPQGRIIASSSGGDAGSNVDMRRLGVRPAAGKESVGSPLPGRGLASLAETGAEPVPPGISFLPLAVGFVNDAGQSLLLVGLLNPDFLSNQQTLALGEEGFGSSITTWNGSVIAASAPALPSVNRAEETPVFRKYLPSQEFGSYLGAGLAGHQQVVAFRASRRQPIVVIVEEPMALATARWIQSAQAFIGVGAASVVLVLLLTVIASRSLRARESAWRQAEIAMKKSARSEAELEVLMQSLQELIFRTDVDGVLTYVNARWTTLSSRLSERPIGRKLEDIVATGDRDMVKALFARDQGLHARAAHCRVSAGPDNEIRLDVAVVPLRSGGTIIGFAGSAVDVTAQWTAQQGLQAQLAFHDLLLESNPLPISLTDLEGRLLQVNRAWEDYKGKPRLQVLGKRLTHVLPEHEARLHRQADQELMAFGGLTSTEAVVSHGDGSRRETKIIKTLVTDARGRATSILCTLMDISEFRAAERATREARDAAEEAFRSKSEFIANMSHELRTPLQSIIGFSELGVLRGGATPKLASMFEDIHSAGQRMLALVNDLLDVAKLESTVGTFHLERVDLRNLVRSVSRELDPILSKAHVHLALEISDHPIIAKADPLRFQQVIRNVLANAIKVSAPGQSIELSAHADPQGQPVVVVRDHGPGIPEAELEMIFEAFVQSSKTKDGSGGTGLGLAICRKILEALGGRIHAQNAPGGGAEFVIVLPARGSQDTVPAPLQAFP